MGLVPCTECTFWLIVHSHTPPPVFLRAAPMQFTPVGRSKTCLQPRLSPARKKVNRSLLTLRSIAFKRMTTQEASGVVDALIPRRPPAWRVVPNLVVLELSDIVVGKSCDIHPIRQIGQAIKTYNQLPVLEELIIRDGHARHCDVVPLAAALKKGNAPQLRVFVWENQCRKESKPSTRLLSTTNLLLGSLAQSTYPRPRMERFSFVNNFSFVENDLPYLRGALQACPGLRAFSVDCTQMCSIQLLDLAYALAMGEVPQLEHAHMRVPVVRAGYEPWQAMDVLKRAAMSKTPPVRLEVRLG